MINVLRLKISDIEVTDDKGLDYYEDSVFNLMDTMQDRELNSRDFSELCRLRIASVLLDENNKDDYINIYANDELHIFVVSFDKVDASLRDMGVLENLDTAYYPIRSLYINQEWEDPFVHYDITRNIFAVPANIFKHNERLLKELQIDEDVMGNWSCCSDIEKYISYDTDYDTWFYDSHGILEDSTYDHYKIGWNYEALNDAADTSHEVHVYNKDGNDLGSMSMVYDIQLNDLLIVKENGKGINNIIDAIDYDFNLSFEPSNELLLFYVAKPTDGFILIAVDPVNEKTATLPIELRLSDYEGITDKIVLDLVNSALYIPLHSVDFITRNIILDLGYSWSKEDMDTIDNVRGMIPEGQQDFLVKEALADINKYGIRKAMENMLDKLIKSKNLRLRESTYEETVNLLIEYFQDIYAERKQHLEEKMGVEVTDLDGFYDDIWGSVDSDYGVDSGETESDEDEIKF